MLVSWMMLLGKDEWCGGRQFKIAELPISWKVEKVDPQSGPSWQEKMQRVLTTHLYVILMPSHPENSHKQTPTHTHTHTNKLPPYNALYNSARMEVQAALNYPIFYSPGTAVTCLALGNSLLKEGYADFTHYLGLEWYWVFRTAAHCLHQTLSPKYVL